MPIFATGAYAFSAYAIPTALTAAIMIALARDSVRH